MLCRESKFCKETCKVLEKNESSKVDKCSDHRYKIRIIERSPLIIYIEEFLQENEIEHLIQLS